MASDKQGGGRNGDKRGRENGRWRVKNEAEGIERQATEGKIGITLDGGHAANSITEHMQVFHTFMSKAALKTSNGSVKPHVLIAFDLWLM